MDTLPNDILNIIFPQLNFNIALVCKKWYQTILNNGEICLDCHKITKMYNQILWITDTEDSVCHGYYGTLERYRILKKMIKENTNFFKYIKRQSVGLCLAATKESEKCIISIKNLSEDLIRLLIKNNFRCFSYIKDPSYNLCLYSVMINPYCIEHVPKIHKTSELCLIAVKCPQCLKYIDEPTEEIYLEAIKSPYWIKSNTQYIKNYTEDICVDLYKKNAWCSELLK